VKQHINVKVIIQTQTHTQNWLLYLDH